MTWRAIVSGGSGNFTFSWTGELIDPLSRKILDVLTGSSQVVTKTYATEGFAFAKVTVTDMTNGDAVTSPDCHSHVIPVEFDEPPNVNPVLWVPNDVDPAPLVPQVERVWRGIRATFVDLYGKTFRMNPLRTIVSPDTEIDICGGDCTEIPGGNDRLMAQAQKEAQVAIGSIIPFTRAIQVLAWGAGGFAGSFGWDIPLGGIGDWALGAVAGVPIPPIPADILEGFAIAVGSYSGAVSDIAHELNHAIGWDDPHDFEAGVPPNDYEKQFVLAGPWLTEIPADVTDPVVTFSAPAADATLSGTVTVSVNASDETSLDAVVFLVDDQFMVIDDTSPFSFQFDTTKVGFGPHQLQAIAYDAAGNTTTATLAVTVQNQVIETACSETFPSGVFHACVFDGTNFEGPHLGTLLDTPFPVPSSNLGTGINHSGASEVEFGQSDTMSVVWRGTLNFPAGNYILRFFTDDGLRVLVNGLLILDEWRDQVAAFARVVALAGPTPIQIEWFQNGGSHALAFRWQPTALEPPVRSPCDDHQLITTIQCVEGKVCRGTPGNDVIKGTQGNDRIYGFGGDDTICALGGDDLVSGGTDNDTIDGGDGNDRLYGGPGKDTIFGGAGDDLLSGASDDDTLDGGTGNDLVYGGGGEDFCGGERVFHCELPLPPP